MKTFQQLGIKEEFIQALTDLSIATPTEIQEKVIPYLIEQGTDMIGQANTGTGKTIAFGIPAIVRTDATINKIQHLILAPTRELVQQIHKQLFKLTKHLKDRVFIEAVYGGEKIEEQEFRLSRPTHIVVATPGRLIDLVNRKSLDLSYVETVVLDEADEMLNMGFKADIDLILKYTIGSRNTWLFSATIPDSLKEIITTYLAQDAPHFSVDKKQMVNRNILHQFVTCEPNFKFETLLQFISVQRGANGIVFCRTKAGCEKLIKQLKSKNISAEAIHGDLQQRDREKALRMLKSGKTQLLITTDISARGIDVEDLSYVVHFDLPEKLENYAHRSGRTARAGKKGISLSIVENKEIKKIRTLEQSLKVKFQRITAK